MLPDAKGSRTVCGLTAFLLDKSVKVIYEVNSATTYLEYMKDKNMLMQVGELLAELENINAIH